MNTIKERALEIYNQHIDLATADGRIFRKTVMNQLMVEFGASLASAATHYNNCKKTAPIAGLGRIVPSKGIRRPGAGKNQEVLQDDDDCFSIIELLDSNEAITVGRCRSYLTQGNASEEFDDRIKYKPDTTWILIRGLGPNSGDCFKLTVGEKEIKRYTPIREFGI